MTLIIAVLHILFYLNLFDFMMQVANRNLSNSFKCDSGGIFKVKYEKKSTADIETYKRLHYKLWQISKMINLNFGWILVSLSLQNLSNLLNPIYWIIIDLYEDDLTQNLQVLSM